MKGTIALVLAFACIFALYAEASAKAADTKTKDAMDAKDDKEPSTTTKSAAKESMAKSAAKSAKDTKKSKKDCDTNPSSCGASVAPVCAHDPKNPSAKPRTFQNMCALDVHNCKNGTKLVVKNKGECDGSSTKN